MSLADEDRGKWVPPPSPDWQNEHGWMNGKPPPGDEAEALNTADEDEYAGLSGLLSGNAWLERDLPAPERLLGDLLTTTSRVFLVGQTGLGKTLLGMAIAVGIATGSGFLHWRATCPARVLYVDGEMPAELMKARIADAASQAGCEGQLDQLFVYSNDWAEELAKLYPTLGTLDPLNTEQGQNFVRHLCDIIKPDVVIFDNVQALITGDMKDEVPWTETLPLVAALTARRIGQIWLDHTGHNTARQYGSATKAWRFDAVGIMTALAEDQVRKDEVAFQLSFDHPGKARRRTPENRQDFQKCTIRLVAGHWTLQSESGGTSFGKVSRSRQPFYDALVVVVGRDPVFPGQTLIPIWERECLRRGLIEQPIEDETGKQRSDRFRDFRKAKSDLIGARWIAVEDDRVIDRKGRWA